MNAQLALALLPATDKAVPAQKGRLVICAGAFHNVQIHPDGREQRSTELCKLCSHSQGVIRSCECPISASHQ